MYYFASLQNKNSPKTEGELIVKVSAIEYSVSHVLFFGTQTACASYLKR